MEHGFKFRTRCLNQKIPSTNVFAEGINVSRKTEVNLVEVDLVSFDVSVECLN